MTIPRLVTADYLGEAPSLADGRHNSVEVWRGPGATIVAYSATVEGEHWIDMPGVALFRFSAAGREVQARPHQGADLHLVREAYRRAVVPMMLQATGEEVMHASAVVTAGEVVAFPGASGSGKSTTAVGLSRRGYQVWADDAVALHMAGAGAWAVPMPFRLRLRAEARAFFALDRVAGSGSMGATHIPPNRLPLAAVCVLERVSDARCCVIVEPLAPSVAFQVLLPHAFCFSLHDRSGKRRMVEHYLELVERVPCFAIRFQSGLGRLPFLLDAIEHGVMMRGASARDECTSSAEC